MTTYTSKFFYQGKAAREAGQSKKLCPFGRDTEEARAWLLGWQYGD